ncbi:DUF3006 domain-containing protein [Caldicellulosiruptor changbaiensis]|uniref:Uncharacterized protein n=2 Tax=Caldicellulosiruptor TaxID=44000 RepID=A4XFS9_CALS8|nr:MULTISPECIES: DUF3006 domain-containing protein [Caldicellulosiruptor]ABP65764.1 hypothetical protein Csac_0111 [Caldicellulosiruptor saccharolyticus DSM 8903]AZT89292.1 DUF3006 domain-containing protein [Caldicellulosiruptor changbaiensis]
MKVVIDRFEGKFAVLELENGKIVNVPIDIIPQGAKEGDVLLIEIDKKETENRQKRISKLFEELKE